MVLFLAAEKAFAEREICFGEGESCRLEIPAEELFLTEPFSLLMKQKKEGIWELNGKTAGEENSCILQTMAGEKVTVVLYEKRKSIASGKRIFLTEGQRVNVGRNFNNEVVYRCFSGVEPVHVSLQETEEGLVAEVCPEKESGKAGCGVVYREGILLKGRETLRSGETIRLLGLSVLYLRGLLFCFAGFGTLRISVFEKKLSAMEISRRQRFPGRDSEFKGLLVKSREEWPVTEGELKLELPEKEMVQSRQPLFLTIGPSMTMILPVLLTTLLASRLQTGNGSGKAAGTGFFRTGLLMTGISSFMTVLWGILGYLYRKGCENGDRKRKRKEYLAYLREMGEYLQELMEQNRRALLHNAPSGRTYLEEGCMVSRGSIYARHYTFLRLGLADKDSPYQVKLEEDRIRKKSDLYRKARELAEDCQRLKAVPAGFDFRKESEVGFTGEKGYGVLIQALLQLVACHERKEVRIACFYQKERKRDRELAEGIRWLPHIWTEDGKRRFLAGDEQEAGEILPDIGRFLSEKGKGQFFLLLILESALICNEDIYENLGQKEGEETAVWFLAERREELPATCSCLVRNDCRSREILWLQEKGNRIKEVLFDQGEPREIWNYMRKMSQNAGDRNIQEMIPDRISFLELYNAEKTEDLHCDHRYQEYRVPERLKVPVGMGSRGRKIYLDIHEKFHGPHGLIAGTTGSGKSELLQTFLLSLAVSFRPDALSFFIIDYKGGGMGRELQELPHCVGLISNLSGGQIHRALVSVKSENRRRQKLLKEAGVSHVSDYAALYRDGIVREALPHLLIVVDEFAELKKEVPEFMQEIISVSQVGRSLGVHLLLATQKPAGTVDDRIFSNTGFRLCLKVADRQDSMDMLKRPEAAYLTGSGRCYLQAGNQEVFELFQTGYGGENYEEETKKRMQTAMVTETGRRIRKREERGKAAETQLQAVIRYIRETAERKRITGCCQLWMPELPEKVDLLDLQSMRNFGRKRDEQEECFLGLVDAPQSQRQFPLTYCPETDGNLLLCGMAATGKSTFLQTILYQIAGGSFLKNCFLLVSMDNLSLSCFQDMPGCLGILKDVENMESFFYHTEKLFLKRKKELSGMNYWQYRERYGSENPLLFLLIDDYGSFRELTGDRFQELIERIAGEGNSYGVYLILTALGAGKGEVQGRLQDQCRTTFCLEMSDVLQYAEVLRKYHIEVYPKENCRGRGLCRRGDEVLEVQFALCRKDMDDYGRIEEILRLCKEVEKQEEKEEGEREQAADRRGSIEKFPYMPVEATFEEMYRDVPTEGRVWIGYDQKTAEKVALPMENGSFFLISGAVGSGRRTLFCGLLYGILKSGGRAALFEGQAGIMGRLSALQEKGAALCDISEETVLETWLAEEWKEENQASEPPAGAKEYGGMIRQKKYLCVVDPEGFHRLLTEAERDGKHLREKLEAACQEGMQVLTMITTGQEMNLCASWLYEKHRAQPCGIHLGGNVGNQRLLSFTDLPYNRLNRKEKPGTGYLTEGSYTVVVKLPQEIREEKNDSGRGTGADIKPAL